MNLKHRALIDFYVALWAGRRESGGPLFESFMQDFRHALGREQDYQFLLSVAGDGNRHEGVLRHGAKLWQDLAFRPGDSLLEMGPGHGLLALKAALGGVHVTLIEHPASPFLPFLRHCMALLKGGILAAGGQIEVLLADLLSPQEREVATLRLRGRWFDHVAALDVFCCDGQTSGFVQRALQGFSWGTKSSAAYYGIYNLAQELDVLTFLLGFKQPARGRVYINHTYSWGRNIDQVREGRFTPLNRFRAVAGLERALAANGLKARALRCVPTTRNPLPCAVLYEVGGPSTEAGSGMP